MQISVPDTGAQIMTFRPLPPAEIRTRCEAWVMSHPKWQEGTWAHFNTTGATIGIFIGAALLLVPLIGWILSPLIAFPSLLYLMKQSGMMQGSQAAQEKEAALSEILEKSRLMCEGTCPHCGHNIVLAPQHDVQTLDCPECNGNLLYANGKVAAN